MASRAPTDAFLLLFTTPLVLWTGCGPDKSDDSGPSKCVAAGTLVATPRGWVAIEALKVGDPIFAIDLERGALVDTEVVSLRRARRECLALVADDGRELLVTPDHPVHVPEVGGFVEAGRVALRQAASLTLVDGALPEARVRRHDVGEHRLYAGVHDVFDVGVASEHHNFVAGGFVVHNKSTTCPPSACKGTTTTDGETTTEGESESGTDTGAPTTSTTGSSSDTTAGSTGDPATFPCGEQAVCLVAFEYCEVLNPGMVTHTCRPLPEDCVELPSCACLGEHVDYGSCTQHPEGGLTVTVPAP